MLSIPPGMDKTIYVKKKPLNRPFCVWFCDYLTRPFKWVIGTLWSIVSYFLGKLAMGCNSWLWGWIFFILVLALFVWSMAFRILGYGMMEGMTRSFAYMLGATESIPIDTTIWLMITANYSEPI
jgi:hypothetical protein